MSNPLISIIMPTYDHGSYISDAIQSVLNQTYSNWELIIVNDGSTDNTDEIVKSYTKKDNRILYFKNKSNLGIARSRQISLDNSKGDYIGHLDSDDILYPNALAEFVQIIDSRPESKFIYSDFEDVDITNSNVLRTSISPDRFSKNNIPGWHHFGMYEKKAGLAVGGYNDFFDVCEDGYLAISLATRYKTHHINKILYRRRIHGKNISYKIIDGCNKCAKYTICPYIKRMNEVYFKRSFLDRLISKLPFTSNNLKK